MRIVVKKRAVAEMASPAEPAAAAHGATRHPRREDQGRCFLHRCACSRLTAPRERQVFHLLMAGKTEKEAAAALGISPHTIHDYAKRLYRRFDVSNHLDLMALVMRLILGPPTPRTTGAAPSPVPAASPTTRNTATTAAS